MNDKQMLEQAIDDAKEVVRELEEKYKRKLREATKNAWEVITRLEKQHKELYGYKDSEITVLADLVRSHGAKGLTVREIRRKGRMFGSMASNQVEEAANSLVVSGGLVKVCTQSPSGRGKPRVSYVAKEFSSI